MNKVLQIITVFMLSCMSVSVYAHPHESITDEMVHHVHGFVSLDNILILLSLLAVAFIVYSRQR